MQDIDTFNRVRAILNLFENAHPPGFETLEFQNFFFYPTS